MKLGICCGTDAEVAKIAVDFGYDYLEFGLNEIMALDEDTFKRKIERVDELGSRVLSCNGLFPGTLKFVGEDIDWEKSKNMPKRP